MFTAINNHNTMKKGIFPYILLAALLLHAVLPAFAQSSGRPGWIVQKPRATNSTYIYVVESAKAATVEEGERMATEKVVMNTAQRLGVWTTVQDGAVKYDDTQMRNRMYKVCSYAEPSRDKQGYVVYMLYQVATSGNVSPMFDYDFSACHDTRQYSNGMAALKSAIIPGLGQMGKRHYGSGIFTLLGEAALVGGAVGTYIAAEYDVKPDLNSAKITADLDWFQSKYDDYRVLRVANVALWSAAGAFYIYNIVRAATMTPRYRRDAVALAPTVQFAPGDVVAPGLGITLSF